MATLSNESAIARVFNYIAQPVETCDRCNAGIKHVFVVVYRDGSREKFGSECINKILNQAPDLMALFQKNSKLLTKYQEYVSIMTGPVDQMPRGSEYFGSGLYFVADSKGKDLFFKHWYFHPQFDAEKNGNGNRYVVEDATAYARKSCAEIARDLPAIQKEVERIEIFLARIMNKARAMQQVAA